MAYKDYASIMKNKGFNGFGRSDVNKNYFEYTVKKGDTLWTIAQRYLGIGYKYKEIRELNALNSDMIYAGQTLKVPK